MLMRVITVRVEYRWLHARLLLAASANLSDKKRKLKEVHELAQSLESEEAGFAKVMAMLVRATIAIQQDQPEQTKIILENTIKQAQEEDMFLHAAVAQHQLGKLISGDEGAALRKQGTSWMTQEGISDLARISEMITPGLTKT